MLQETISIIKAIAGNEYLFFDKAIQVTKPPIETFITAVIVSPANQLYAVDDLQQDYHIKESDYKVTQLIYLRMKEIERKVNKPIHPIGYHIRQYINALQQASQR